MAMPSGTLDIWFNVFIPYHVQGYTRRITQGGAAGRSAVPLPGLARGLNPTADWDLGFLTDQRSFSPEKMASVRIQAAVSIAVSPGGMTPTFARPRTSGTVGVKLNSGAVTGRSDANMQACTFVVEEPGFLPAFGRFLPASGAHTVLVLKLTGAASDPLVLGSADIDYAGHFKIAQSEADGRLTVDFLGLIDAFPAYECYASWNGDTRKIFAVAPPPGNTVVDLLFGPNRTVSGQAEWSVLKGPDARPSAARFGRA
jgi:hypothetical protein